MLNLRWQAAGLGEWTSSSTKSFTRKNIELHNLSVFFPLTSVNSASGSISKKLTKHTPNFRFCILSAELQLSSWNIDLFLSLQSPNCDSKFISSHSLTASFHPHLVLHPVQAGAHKALPLLVIQLFSVLSHAASPHQVSRFVGERNHGKKEKKVGESQTEEDWERKIEGMGGVHLSAVVIKVCALKRGQSIQLTAFASHQGSWRRLKMSSLNQTASLSCWETTSNRQLQSGVCNNCSGGPKGLESLNSSPIWRECVSWWWICEAKEAHKTHSVAVMHYLKHTTVMRLFSFDE